MTSPTRCAYIAFQEPLPKTSCLPSTLVSWPSLAPNISATASKGALRLSMSAVR